MCCYTTAPICQSYSHLYSFDVRASPLSVFEKRCIILNVELGVAFKPIDPSHFRAHIVEVKAVKAHEGGDEGGRSRGEYGGGGTGEE